VVDDAIITANPGGPADEVGTYLINTTAYNYNVSDTGTVTTGTGHPMTP